MLGLFKKNQNDPRIYSPRFAELRRTEYFRLDNLEQVYLDYAGANLYPQTLIDAHYNILSEGVLGNPRVYSPTASMSRKLIEEAREAVLDYFDAEDYHCVFIDNSSDLNAFGEHYPFDTDSVLLSSIDSASPINSLRHICMEKGGKLDFIKLKLEDLSIDTPELYRCLESHQNAHKLMAFPAQSSISGTNHSLNHIQNAQNLGWEVLLEADLYAASSPLKLKKIKPEFVSISFYKMFGYPTGLGCLLVRKDKTDYFQTIKMKLTPKSNGLLSVSNYITRIEDETVNFLSIPVVKEGLQLIDKVGIDRIQIRMEKLMSWLVAKIKEIKHDNGLRVVDIYGTQKPSTRGNCILFNIYDQDGYLFSNEYIDQKCAKWKVSLRSGAIFESKNAGIDMCKPEAIATYFTISEESQNLNLSEGYDRICNAVRVSLGVPTIQKDLDVLIAMLCALKNKSSKDLL